MKRKTKIIITLLLLLVICITLYTQIWKPLSVKPTEVQFIAENLEDDYLIPEKNLFSTLEENKTTYYAHSFKGSLPSDNPEDYMTIYCTLKVSNRSIFNINSFKASVFELNNYENNVLFSISSDVVKASPKWRLSSDEKTIRLYVYIGDMNDEALRDLVEGMTARITYEGNFIGAREEIISFKSPRIWR